MHFLIYIEMVYDSPDEFWLQQQALGLLCLSPLILRLVSSDVCVLYDTRIAPMDHYISLMRKRMQE